jgi:hypothetical protein
MQKLTKKFNTRLGSILGFVLLVVTIVTLPHLLFAVASGIGTAFMFASGIVSQGGGRLGDVVVSHNRYGQYIKLYKKPRQPHTAHQAYFRGAFRNFATLWKSDTINRTSFNLAAANHIVETKLGVKHTMTGFTLFQKMNQIAALANGGWGGSTITLITTYPSTSTLFPINTGLTVATTTGPDTVTVQPIVIGTYPTGMMIEIWASKQVSKGVSKAPALKLVGVYDPTTTPAINITSDYEAKFGALVDGLKIYFAGRLVMPTGEWVTKVSQESIVIPLI